MSQSKASWERLFRADCSCLQEHFPFGPFQSHFWAFVLRLLGWTFFINAALSRGRVTWASLHAGDRDGGAKWTRLLKEFDHHPPTQLEGIIKIIDWQRGCGGYTVKTTRNYLLEPTLPACCVNSLVMRFVFSVVCVCGGTYISLQKLSPSIHPFSSVYSHWAPCTNVCMQSTYYKGI